MRTIPPDLQTHLNGECLTLAQCVKLTRVDTTVLGFTTGNLDIEYGDVVYSALSSLGASQQASRIGTGVDNMEVVGILDSEAITEADIQSGLYDNASLEVFVVNWADLTQGRVLLFSGWIGNVTLQDGQFTAEIRSKSQRLSQQVGELTSATCRVVRLGDGRCKLAPMSSYRFDRDVSAVVDNRNFTFAADTNVTGYYDSGLVTFAAGTNNAGLSRGVKVHTLVAGEAVIELQAAFPYDVEVGDTATLEVGCDRRLVTCRDKFPAPNTVNFRGEPTIPGTDILWARGRGDA